MNMEDFTPLRISTIKPNTRIMFNLYINFKDQFLLYKENGLAIGDTLFKKLKDQKIARFFITAIDETNYQKYLDQLLNDTMNRNDTPVAEKASLAEGVAGTAIERMKKDPGSRTAYNMTTQAAGNLRKAVSNNKEALKMIMGKKVEEDSIIVKHCLNVSTLATKLAEMRKLDSAMIDNIAIAGLIHDLGITRADPSDQAVYRKPKKTLSADELKKYNLHPKATAELLQDKPYINAQIINLVLNHEEVLSGDGPQKKKKLDIDEEILSIVDCYDKKVSLFDLSPKQAIQSMLIDELGNYNLELINDLKKLLKEEDVI